MSVCVLRVACCVLRVRVACCVLRVACCVLRVACCVLRVACCVLRVACLTVFVNCLVKQFAMCLDVVAILLLNVMDVFSVRCSALLDRPCMDFQRVCVCCACDPNERLSAPSICFVCVFVCRKLSPHLGHPSLTISITLAPTLPSANFHLLDFSFIRTYSFSLSVSLKPSFHALLPRSCILSQIYFFHPSPST